MCPSELAQLLKVSTVSSSFGNLIAYKSQNSPLKVAAQNMWSMFYGTVFTAIIALNLCSDWSIPHAESYWLALLYLSVVATSMTFQAYVTLIQKIGPEKAAYAS